MSFEGFLLFWVSLNINKYLFLVKIVLSFNKHYEKIQRLSIENGPMMSQFLPVTDKIP